ncbi:HAMP domain-containing histidine kinase [Ramlibacter sp. AW1]|uniref:histidine kinase n=1 Tax=Ramlibacter aurantiacus TaxID=2801330 RepID=A0A937D852_9BURK|nr:HAMP domain-containing sensor histidine kinase [Ramlibacter aurantiacus]MBL0421686.1 HAMP domain-containing histidine kinase [Ramlibacter aurantiacus]
MPPLMPHDAPPCPEAEPCARLREAREALRARDDFLSTAAHELRSPLNALGLQLTLLERLAVAGDPRLLDEIERARRNVSRYVRRATMLLDVSRINSGQVQVHRLPLKVGDVVNAVMDTHADEARFHHVRLSSRVDDDADLVGCWDPQMVEQMVSNLVSNALRYGAGSPVVVSAGLQAPDRAFFRVTDGGPGIPEAERARMFQRFERAVSQSGHRSGFGLGLWIVAQLAAAHHGSVMVDEAPGGGCATTIVLPLQPPEHPSTGESK